LGSEKKISEHIVQSLKKNVGIYCRYQWSQRFSYMVSETGVSTEKTARLAWLTLLNSQKKAGEFDVQLISSYQWRQKASPVGYESDLLEKMMTV